MRVSCTSYLPSSGPQVINETIAESVIVVGCRDSRADYIKKHEDDARKWTMTEEEIISILVHEVGTCGFAPRRQEESSLQNSGQPSVQSNYRVRGAHNDTSSLRVGRHGGFLPSPQLEACGEDESWCSAKNRSCRNGAPVLVRLRLRGRGRRSRVRCSCRRRRVCI